MEKKYMFFDIDGTLTNDNPGGIIEESTFRTLDKLRENGHFVAIATGRAQWMAMDAMKETRIDNAVHDGGNGLTINGQLQFIEPLDKEKALEIIDEATMLNIPVEVVIDNTPNRYTNSRIDKKETFGKIVIDESLDYHELKDIYKIYIDIDESQESKFKKLKTLGYMRYHESGIIIEPDDKYKGIVKMVEHVGGDQKDIVVFGDGHNDYTMFVHAPMSIAMGNAIDELKEIATYITKSNKEDGIEYACKYFGWID